MNCLTGYIGLRGTCDDVTPESNLYINDLPAMGLKVFSSFANEETKNYLGFWEKIERVSIEQLKSDIMVKKSQYFDKQILLSSQNTGLLKTPYETVTASNYYKGILIEMNDTYYGVINLNNVHLYLKSAVNSNIYVYDANDGTLLQTKAFTGVVGNNVIQLNKKVYSYGQKLKLFVCFDASVSNSIKSSPYDMFPDYLINRAAKCLKTDSVIDTNFVYDGCTAGLVVNYNVSCEIDGLICQNREFVKHAFWYLLGKNIMLEAMHNVRFNKYTMTSKEEQKELHDYYADNYDSQLKAALDSIQMTADGVCFSCDKKRTYKHLKP